MMFDIKKAKRKGFDAGTIAVMEKLNQNYKRKDGCIGHDFEPSSLAEVPMGGYRCRNCGYEASTDYVNGYRDAVRHIAASAERRTKSCRKSC